MKTFNRVDSLTRSSSCELPNKILLVSNKGLLALLPVAIKLPLSCNLDLSRVGLVLVVT